MLRYAPLLTAFPRTTRYESSPTTTRSTTVLSSACRPADCDRCDLQDSSMYEATGSFSALHSLLSRNTRSIRVLNAPFVINPFSYNSNSLSLRRLKCSSVFLAGEGSTSSPVCTESSPSGLASIFTSLIIISSSLGGDGCRTVQKKLVLLGDKGPFRLLISKYCRLPGFLHNNWTKLRGWGALCQSWLKK